MRHLLQPLSVLVVVFPALCGTVRADYVELKNGTVIEGTVLKKSDGYWVKSKAGEAKTYSKDEVKSAGKGSPPAKAKPAVAGKLSASGKSAVGAKPTTNPTASKTKVIDYTTAERRANVVEVPMSAVTIWQEFIDSEPTDPAELEEAKIELAKWQKLADGGAEKIKGKWVTGDERKAIVEKAQSLYQEGSRMMAANQTLQALEKLKESVAVYPNNFQANFHLGYIMLIQHKPMDGKKYFDTANKIRPNSPEVMANLAIIEVDKRQHVKAIEMLHKAAQQGDNKAIVQNLIVAIATAPPAASRNQKVKPAIEAARLLAAKHGLPQSMSQFLIVPLSPGESSGGGKGDPLAAGMTSGSGFLISKEGLILTNRHVVEHGKSFLVMINGRKQRSAEIVKIDEEQDLALIKVKPEDGEDLPTVRLANTDVPGDGAACTVMGYPLIDRLGAAIKVTRGVVSSAAQKFDSGPDVVIDAKVNPGNSGGPILDKHGDVMAIVSMKTVASATEDTYGLGISAGRIRKFLSKNNVTLQPAETSTQTLDTEEVATKVKPAAVCILATR
jgi:S1-C subfamily serine protease